MRPPLAPMLASLARALPAGDWSYEPKWDGFRCLVRRDGDDVDLRSRNDRPFARYFPELVDAVRSLPERRLVLDGEIVGPDFDALLKRIHPAARHVTEMVARHPARLLLFDALV